MSPPKQQFLPVVDIDKLVDTASANDVKDKLMEMSRDLKAIQMEGFQQHKQIVRGSLSALNLNNLAQ